jgi:hypothetical protein
MPRFRPSISLGYQIQGDIIYHKRTATQNTQAVVEKARLNTKEGFIAFREYVCFPQVAANEEGVEDVNDIAAYKYARPKHHSEWMDVLFTGEDSRCLKGVGGKNTLILAPRLSAKSRFTTEWIAHQIGVQTSLGVAIKIIIVSYSITVAIQKSVEIKRIIESERYQQVFPSVRKSRKWSDECWEIDKRKAGLEPLGEPYTLACAGILGSITSRRAHVVLFDDLIKSPNDIENPTVREKMASTYHSAIKPTLFPGGRQLCLGTRARADDIYATDFNEDKGWAVIEQQAIVDNGNGEESYWEEFIPLEHLLALRDPDKGGDPLSFSFQYQNKVMVTDSLSIPSDWLRFINPSARSAYKRFCIGSDLADSIKQKADFTVFTLIGVLPSTEIDVLGSKRFKASGNVAKLSHLLELLYDNDLLEIDENGWENPNDPIAQQFPLKYKSIPNVYADLFLEDVSQQLSIMADFNALIVQGMGIRSIYPKGLKMRGDKRERLMVISGGLQTGKIKFNKFAYSPKQSTIKELLFFGSTSHDDFPDSLTCAVIGAGQMKPLS